MYSTCLFCNADLGHNEVIEHFPVGRRLAFDAAKGRLWVVCRKCERWNLTPLEERWEAIEEAERVFSQSRLRVSTDNIGLAKMREGLVLIRIGSALRPEMAAWRYGDQFGRRRTKYMLVTGAGIAAVLGLYILGPATGVVAGGGWGTWQILNTVHRAYQSQRVRARIRLPDSDDILTIRKKQLKKVAIVRDNDSWALRVPMGRGRRLSGFDTEKLFTEGGGSGDVLFTGPHALKAASKLLPAVNEKGARASDVRTAVDLVTEAGDPQRLFRRYAGGARLRNISAGGHVIDALPKEVRLAMEMVTHEEEERRALEGELAILEAAWREAEEVAKISDDMFLPAGMDDQLENLKKRG